MALADLMVVMDEGHIRQAGAPREIFERPASSFVAASSADTMWCRGTGCCDPGGPLPAWCAGSGPTCRGGWLRSSIRAPLVRVALETEFAGRRRRCCDKLFYAARSPRGAGDAGMVGGRRARSAERLSPIRSPAGARGKKTRHRQAGGHRWSRLQKPTAWELQSPRDCRSN